MVIIPCVILSKNINTCCLTYQNKGVFSMKALMKVGVVMFLWKRERGLSVIGLSTAFKCFFALQFIYVYIPFQNNYLVWALSVF